MNKNDIVEDIFGEMQNESVTPVVSNPRTPTPLPASTTKPHTAPPAPTTPSNASITPVLAEQPTSPTAPSATGVSLETPQPLTTPPAGPSESLPTINTSAPRFMGRGSRLRWIIIIGGIVIILLGTGLALWVKNRNAALPESVEDLQPINTSTNTTTNANTNTRTNTNTRPPVTQIVDADGDGLIDTEEESLGTNRNVVDTDADGLTDREEVRIYKTNPLKEDTDKDGYTDGEEVRNFYNPNGSGKLLNTNEAINQFNEEQ